VKANTVGPQHRAGYARIAASLEADACLIACTELSVLGAPENVEKPVVDALDALVRATIAEAKA
jgi:aspartate/glutamate racemase